MESSEIKNLGTAVFLFGAAFGLIRWVGRLLREQLGPGLASPEDAPTITHVDNIPPALVKQAIERGLVTASQLAAMKPMERQFLFASLAPRLAAPEANVVASGGQHHYYTPRTLTPPAGMPMRRTPPTGTPLRGTPASGTPGQTPPGRINTPVRRAIGGAEFGMVSIPANDRLYLHCPTCGEMLDLPAFAPYVALCSRCEGKTSVREGDGGQLLLHVTPGRRA